MKPPARLVIAKGVYYAQITVPKEHRASLNGQKQLRASTGTSDRRIAESLLHDTAQKLYDKLPDPIEELREAVRELSGPSWEPTDMESAVEWGLQAEDEERRQDEIGSLHARIERLEAERNCSSMTIRELADLWFETTPYPLQKTLKDAQTSIDQFIAENGNLVLSGIDPTVGYGWAESLGAKLGNKTVKKKLSYVSSAMSWGITRGHLKANPFLGLKLSPYGKKSESYVPLTSDEVRALLAIEMPHTHKLLLEILAFTGMRLDEAALLSFEDIQEEDRVTFFDLTGTDKQIKNISSRRKVPVPTTLLDTVERLKSRRQTGRVFREFRVDDDGKAQAAASKVLMSYVRQVTDDPRKVVHSLRGSFKDRLRDANVSKEVNDFITGHGSGDVAGSYGRGPSLSVRKDAIDLAGL